METYISRTKFNPKKPSNFEKVEGKSLTVTGDSYTIKELFARHMSGMATAVERPSFYQDTQDFDAIDFDYLRHADPYEKESIFKDVEAKAKKARLAIAEYNKQQKELQTQTIKNNTVNKDDDAKPSQAGSKKAKEQPQGATTTKTDPAEE